ncbi:unnamed protein product [Rhizophagus irregularis]|nr:unnamed protein product [Rhizophagus irregularis]
MKNKKEKVEENTLYIAPIQITLNKETHSDSEASFFSGIWPELESKILGGLKVEQRTIEINPQYTSIVKAFSCVNIELENILSRI